MWNDWYNYGYERIIKDWQNNTLLISLLWCLFLFFNKFMTYDVCSCLLLKYFRSQLWNDWRLILSKRICMVSDTFSNFHCTHVKFCWYFPDWIQFGLYTIFVIYLNEFFFTMIGFSLEYRPTFSIYTAHTICIPYAPWNHTIHSLYSQATWRGCRKKNERCQQIHLRWAKYCVFATVKLTRFKLKCILPICTHRCFKNCV